MQNPEDQLLNASNKVNGKSNTLNAFDNDVYLTEAFSKQQLPLDFSATKITMHGIMSN